MCVHSAVFLHICLWGHVCAVSKSLRPPPCSLQPPHQHSVPLPPATSAGDHRCVLLTFLAARGQKTTHLAALSPHWYGKGEELLLLFSPFFRSYTNTRFVWPKALLRLPRRREGTTATLKYSLCGLFRSPPDNQPAMTSTKYDWSVSMATKT